MAGRPWLRPPRQETLLGVSRVVRRQEAARPSFPMAARVRAKSRGNIQGRKAVGPECAPFLLHVTELEMALTLLKAVAP